MAGMKERRQKNVKFGLSKDDNFDLSSMGDPQDEGNAFNSTREYWQHICKGGTSSDDRKDDLSNRCIC